MHAERRPISPTPDIPSGVERVFSFSMSRRSLLRGAAAMGLLAVSGAPAISNHAEQERKREYERSFSGFDGLSLGEFNELVQSYNEVGGIVAVDSITDLTHPKTITFDLKGEGSMVFVTIKAGTSDPVFAQPLIIRNEHERPYLASVLHGREDQKTLFTGVNIGKHEAGSHQIIITQDGSSTFSLEEPLQVFISAPGKDALLTKFMENTPVLKLKDPSNVMDDMPLVTFAKILKKGDMYQVIKFIIFSSENGGTLPPGLMDAYRRTVDIEWLIQQLYTTRGELLYNRRMYQTKNHGRSQFNGEEIDDQPVLYTATQNNNFADSETDYTRIHGRPFNNPLKRSFNKLVDIFTDDARDKKQDIYYSPVPIFIPSNMWGADILEMYPQLQDWSLYEVAFENCVDLTNTDEPQVKAFLEDLRNISQFIQREYPDRGCGRRKVQLAA